MRHGAHGPQWGPLVVAKGPNGHKNLIYERILINLTSGIGQNVRMKASHGWAIWGNMAQDTGYKRFVNGNYPFIYMNVSPPCLALRS